MQTTERSTRSSKKYVAEPAPGPQNTDSGQYMCIECSQTFDNKLELNSHRQSHVTKKQFMCSLCGRGFHHQVFLQMHERSHEGGISRTSLTKTNVTPARVISTRSTKSTLDADIIHVTPPANKPPYHLNSKVQFKRDLSSGRDIAPRECLTRRTQGTSSPDYEQTDSSDERAQFELRISKLSDSTIHLIDPYGNTLEILAEVFNAYAIGETEEDDEENVSPIAASRISEISAASTSSSVHLNVPDEIMQDSRVLPSPQAEVSRPHESINTAEKKEDLPLCRLQSVSSASMSPKTLPDVSDDAEDVLSTQAPHESDIQDVTSSEHTVRQPASEVPKNSTEEENLPSISQDSLTTCGDLMVTEEPILRDVTACNSAGPDQTETPSLEPDALNHPSSVQWEPSEVLHGGHLHTEDRPSLSQPMPPEPLTNLTPEKDASTSSLTPVTSNEQEDKSLTVASSISGLSLDLNEGSAQLSDSCVNDSQSDIVIENDMQSQKSDEGGAGLDEGERLERAEVPLASVDESQEVPLVGDDSMMLQTPLTLNECLSKSDELHVESLSCTRDAGSSGHDNNLQTDPSTSNTVCKTPVDDEKVDPKYESNENQTALESELKPGSTEADVCSLSEGVSDGASYPSDICSSELESQNLGMSLDFADQTTIDSSDFEAVSMKRDTGEKVFTSLESPASQPVMPEKIPQVSSSTVPFLQEQCEEPLLADGPAAHNKTDLVMPDTCQKNDDGSELNPKSGPDRSSPLHDIETLKSNDPEQDENLSSKSELEADLSSDIRQIGSSENEEKRTNPIAAPVATPTEALPLANIDTELDEALSHENIQTPVHVTKSVDVENVNASQKIAVVESGEDKLLNLLEPMTEGTRSDLLPPCDEDLSLRNNENSHDVPFSVQTLVNLTTACVQAQERVLSQGTKPPDQDAAESMASEAMFMSSSLIANTDFKDDVLLEKPKVEALLPALCLLEPTLDLSPDLEHLSEKCLLNSDDVKDLADNDLDKDLSHEIPHKQYIQMSNADLTENDLADDFVDPETILLDAPCLEETKEDISAVSVDDESTIHELSDILSPDLLDSEYTEGLDDKQMGFRGQCLKCGRRVRRGRKELVWFPDCYKCRLKAKRHSSDFVLETSLDRKKGLPDSSNFHVKQEAESAQDSAFYRAESPPLKTFKCPKCEKSFRKSALLAIHVKCHSLPQCLSCGCPVPPDYKTKRTPKRCHKCVQKIKQQKKAERVLCGDDEDDSLDSDSESPFVDEVDLESLSDNEPENDQILSSTSLEEDSKPGSAERETEPFHSISMRKSKKMSPAIQALYCTCQVVLKSGAKQPKICKSCQKPTRDRLVALPKDSLIVGDHAGVGGRVPQLKKTKKQTQSEPDQQNLSLGESSVSCENELSPDEFCKEETEPELDISDQMVLPDGKQPRLCPQCGKIFKCNRSMKLHLLSHTATQCESCGCRLQKKKRAGRWAKKCRVCRLLTKTTGLPDGAMEDVLPSDKISKEKGMTSLRRKMKQSKAVRNRKIQPIAKHKKTLKWMNMMLAVKGLTRKPRKKKEQTMKGPNEEKSGYSSEPSVYSGTVGKATFLKHLSASPKSDPGSSGLHLSQKKLLGRIPKINRKCMYREKNIIKVEEQQMSPYIGDPSKTQVSVKEEDENQCLECNEIFSSFDLLLSHQQSHVGDPPFTCTQCPQSFSAEQYLSIHVGSHAEGPPFRCPDCNKTFPKRNNLGVHRRVHTGARPYACPDCPCKFRQRGSLILHRYTHRNLQFMMAKPYQCSICNKSFKQKERLVIHERLHTGECPFSCKDCDKVFPSKSRLYAHRKIHKVPGTLSNVEQNAICKEELGELLPFQCKVCGKVCSTKASLVLHCKVHKSSAISNHGGSHGENVETTKEMPLVSESNLHIKTELEGHPFTCKDCNKVCSTKASLVLHRKVHGPDPRPGFGSPGFVCKDCHKVYSTKAKLFLHRKMHKSSFMCGLKANIGDPPYVCQECNKVCSTKASFVLHSKVHWRSASSEHILKGNMKQKSFVCKVCNFVCSTKASFVLHRKVHRSSPSLVQSLKDGTVQSPFTCKDCNKVCSTKASLVLHSRVHRALPGNDQNPIPQADVKEKPYHCKECGKIYSTKGRLLSHMKLHTGQDMSEDGGQQLKMDTEEKPFACPICLMRFTRLKILVRHKLIHGEDVFKCGHCGKRFLFHKSLLNHVPVCLKRTKGKSLLGKEKVPKKRKTKDGNSSEESAPKKRKPDNKKAVTAVQKLKNKKLIKAKQLALKKEKSKAKGGDEKKLKKAKAEAEQEPDPEGEKQSDGKQEKPLETVSKEKEIVKDKKPKEMGKVKKVLKKVPVKQKRQKVGSESLKKWRMIAAATVKKRKLQAVITGGKKKVTVKKKGPNKAKTGGKNSKE
ncbi:uncharacterized protein LOC121000943 [Bufo bufo]|uniref:uncharacterized protein LOC121000943 n=1 Tax=Bufo bufo TaxID=8384 RepID=UPI001ABDE162|nr:uncharacterized protein LOC121000943 [Bufo bufo]